MYFYNYNIILLKLKEKSPTHPRNKKKDRKKVVKYIIETYMVKATIC